MDKLTKCTSNCALWRSVAEAHTTCLQRAPNWLCHRLKLRLKVIYQATLQAVLHQCHKPQPSPAEYRTV